MKFCVIFLWLGLLCSLALPAQEAGKNNQSGLCGK